MSTENPAASTYELGRSKSGSFVLSITINAHEITGDDIREMMNALPLSSHTLALTPNLEEKLQHLLATAADGRMRASLAANWFVHPNVQLVLAKDKLWSVRATLARNPEISEATKNLLSHDKNKDVRTALQRTHQVSSELPLE